MDLKNRGVIKRNKKESAGLKKRGFKGGKKRAGPVRIKNLPAREIKKGLASYSFPLGGHPLIEPP